MLSLKSSNDEEFSDYFIDYLLTETFKSYYATIDGLTIDPVWIPKACITKDLTVKDWWVKLFKEGKTEWKKEEKKIVQKKLEYFFDT